MTNHEDFKTFSSLTDKKISITKNSPTNFVSTSRSGNFLISYDATEENGVYVSRLKIIDFANNEKITNTNFTLNINKKGYKLLPYLDVLSEAEKVKANYTLQEIENIAITYEQFAKMLLNEQVNTNSELIQSLFFHYAVLSTVKRSLQNNENCNCTPHPGYFVGKNPFFCQEDYKIDTKRFLSALEDKKFLLKGQEIEVYSYLKEHINEREVTSDKLLSIMMPTKDFMIRVERTIARDANITYKMVAFGGDDPNDCDPLPGEGSGLGCCGNYNGCCWYWSIMCLDHDLACYCCDHWYCLWGCQAEPGCK